MHRLRAAWRFGFQYVAAGGQPRACARRWRADLKAISSTKYAWTPAAKETEGIACRNAAGPFATRWEKADLVLPGALVAGIVAQIGVSITVAVLGPKRP
ncbi:MAG TPA: hypothetical protein VGN42_07345 [Pirellulales bacterium]|nr:hypothetical protein [Pirellulales bacterium]